MVHLESLVNMTLLLNRLDRYVSSSFFNECDKITSSTKGLGFHLSKDVT